MGCNLVVALGRATVDGETLFGQNSNRRARSCQPLRRTLGRTYAAGERLRTQYLELPQARQTCTVLGSQPLGFWGYDHGVNEFQVAAGCTALRPTLSCAGPGLLGTDLVRLILERCRSARHGVDLLTDLIERFGQGRYPGCPAQMEADHAFLIADGREAIAVEAAGPYWVYQEIGEVRAVSDARVMRQDWDRIAHGLATHAIAEGWWPADGSKLDFAGALGERYEELRAGLRRWGRATLGLQQQNGHIDTAFLRRLLSDHDEVSWEDWKPTLTIEEPIFLCQHAVGFAGPTTVASMVTRLSAKDTSLPLAWCAFGPPCSGIYFPIFLEGDLPEPFTSAGLEVTAQSFWWRVYRAAEHLQSDSDSWALARESFDRLQGRFDQEAEELVAEGIVLKARGAQVEFERQATSFMQHNLECFEAVSAELAHGQNLGLKGPRAWKRDAVVHTPRS
jgi:secernin